jgi:peptide/nickel transport system permease protein
MSSPGAEPLVGLADAGPPADGADLVRAHRRVLGGAPPELVIGGALIAALLVLTLVVPVFIAHSPSFQDPNATLLRPSWDHLFGTDQYGRDIFTRTLYAGRIDFLIGAVLVGIASVVGTAVGLVAAWARGLTDAVVLWLINIGFALPFLVLVISIVGLRGPGLGSLILAVSLVSWIFYARLVRGEVVVLKDANYIRAARLSGFSTARVLTRHVLPNVASQVLLYATSDLIYAILLGASVSYLGLGVQPPTPEWGAMVQEGQSFITTQWWLALFPGLAIMITGIGFALIGDGLADLLRTGRSR